MPHRYVRMIGEHAENNKAREAARNTAGVGKRVVKLLDKLNPRKDPDLLKPVQGANLMTEWERSFGQLASLILLDEIATVLLQELPAKDEELRAETELVDEIGAEGMRRVPEITLSEYKKIADDLEREK